MRVAALLVVAACSGRPPEPSTITSTTPAAPAVKNGSFGGRAMWAPLTEPFTATRVRAQQESACAVSKQGKVACWGKVEADDDSTAVERRAGISTPVVLAGIDGAIDVAEDWFFLCVAQRPDAGPGGCFLTNDIGNQPAPAFPSPPVEVMPGNHGICARMRDGSVGCVDLKSKYTAVAGIRDASHLSCGRDDCCAITPVGVKCFGQTKLPKLPAVTALAFTNEKGCARTQTGGAQCWGEASALSQTKGVRDVATLDHGSAICVIGDDGTFKCTDDRIPPTSNVIAAEYSCVAHADGSVGCYGWNQHGELGDGALMLSALPVQVPGLDDVVNINIAHTNGCAVRRDQHLWCWGPEKPTDRGTADTLIPAQYVSACRSTGTSIRCGAPSNNGEWESQTITPPKSVKKITAAAMHRDSSVCIVDGNGAVQCQHGMSEGGVDARWVPLGSPAPVEEIDPLGVGFCARHTDGRVSCFVDHRYDNDDDFLETLPVGKLELVPGIKDATQLATGQDLACVITKAAEVWCWSADDLKRKPVEMSTLKGATALGANHLHTCAIVRGEVWCWGDNFLGELGTGTGSGRIEPVQSPVKAKASFKAIKVGTGEESTCALDDQGKVWCWGANTYGQLGHERMVSSNDAWSKVVGVGPR